jgi:predicted NUDIX family NTP pyrophosphohydrolase
MVTSAGILPYRVDDGGLEVLLGHPGGPFFATKDAGAWSVLKGEANGSEDLLAVARREFLEETGHVAPEGEMLALGEIVQRGGKRVVAWAVEGDLDPAEVTSNTFEMEWPPRSGRTRTFPEVDRVAWFDLDEARTRINPAQSPFLDRLGEIVRGP